MRKPVVIQTSALCKLGALPARKLRPLSLVAAVAAVALCSMQVFAAAEDATAVKIRSILHDRFPEVISWVNEFDNLFLVGRNGMHKYNNQDHSMLTAMTAVDNIIANVRSRDNLWALNTEKEYHEEKTVPEEEQQEVSAA